MIFNKRLMSILGLNFITFFTLSQDTPPISLKSDFASIAVDSSIVCPENNSATGKDCLLTLIDSSPSFTKTKKNPNPYRDWKRLGYSSSMYVGSAIIAFGVIWTLPERVTNWHKDIMKKKGVLWKWKENVNAGPAWDADNWALNWITHPYCGGIYYMTGRSNGFTVLESFGYSAMMSTLFWEYGIEAFAERPSVQDLVITPVVGSAVGEGFFYAKKSILRHDKKVLKSRFLGIGTLFLIDPFNTVLDGLGCKDRVKTQMNVAPVAVHPLNKSTIWGVQFSARF
jgi:hypothetical protein